MSKKQTSSIKKEIFLPPAIGDWTTYTSEKNKQSISITKSIGISNKTVSEKNINQLLFFHHEFFEEFFEKIAQKINSHIEIESIAINILNHELFKEGLTQDIYQCKFSIPELEQIDLILSKKATKFIAHRLCGGNTPPEESDPPTTIEISLVSVINNLFIEVLSEKWKTIFPVIKDSHESSFGHYQFHPQQAENETIIELTANFKLFNQTDLQCKIIYSLETVEKLLFFEELLNNNIVENTTLSKTTLKKTRVPIKSVIGTTSLALNEIQNIEIGDVILIENQKLNDPIQLIVDDTIAFNANPIQINDNELGVQITGYPTYDSFIKGHKKPSTGPFISTGQKKDPDEPINETAAPMDIDSAPMDFDNAPMPEDTPPDIDQIPNVDDPIDPTPMEQADPMMNDQAISPMIEPETQTELESSDDFSWDDLDNE